MASGSYITIYLKDLSRKLDAGELESLKKEYADKHSKSKSAFNEDSNDSGIPLLLRKNAQPEDSGRFSPVYSSVDGHAYTKLLSFSFNSSFEGLKRYFSMNAYEPSKSDVELTQLDASLLLTACKYILGKKYDRDFEDVMSNPFVEELGNDLTHFTCRFDKSSRETADECDKYYEDNLKTLIACLNAYAESDEEILHSGVQLKLVYSVWG